MKKIRENKYRKAGAYLGLVVFATVMVSMLLIFANTGDVIVSDNINVEYSTR
ncbi:unnamed protein product, partial [marine sediment metagenome]